MSFIVLGTVREWAHCVTETERQCQMGNKIYSSDFAHFKVLTATELYS